MWVGVCGWEDVNEIGCVSLVPRHHPAFHRLQYRKAGRAWYLFSCEHDVISKSRKIAELTARLRFAYFQSTMRSTLSV